MGTANVWIRDLNDRLVGADQILGMYVDRVDGLGWTVIVTTRLYGDVALADFGRGGRARTGADHLLARLPGAIAAAAQDSAACQITYTPGLTKGSGDWSTTRDSPVSDAAPQVDRTRGPRRPADDQEPQRSGRVPPRAADWPDPVEMARQRRAAQ